VGVFCDEQFSTSKANLSPGSTLLLYSDGLSETRNPAGVEYGHERLSRLVSERYELSPEGIIDACLKDLRAFRGSGREKDDLTIMAIRRSKN
jgi:sigma-B regulation protein RsbU (phosphoserine phosphatase)